MLEEAILKRLLDALRDALKGANNKDFSTLEADVEAILAQLDVALSTRASETTLASIDGKVATEATLSAIKNALASVGTDELLTTPDNPPNLDIALSAHRDALLAEEHVY
jgi:hypothetical protein